MPNSKFALFGGRTILALAALIGIIGIFGVVNSARFHSRVAKLKADGELVDINDLLVHVENKEDDAMTYLNTLIKPSKEISAIIPRGEDGLIDTNEESIALFDSTMTNYPDFFDQLSLAAAAPKMSYEGDEGGGWGTNILERHRIMSVAAWKGQVLNAKGDPNGAAKVALELLQLAEKSKPPTLITSLLDAAHRVTACQILYDAGCLGSIDPEILDEIFSLMDKLDSLGEYRSALKAERSISTYYMINRPEIESNPFQSKLEWVVNLIPSGPAMVAGNPYLDQMERAINRTEIPLTTQFEDEPPAWSILTAFGGDSGAQLNNFRNAIGQKSVVNQATRIALTLQHDELASERTSWPVDYLVSLGIPEEMTTDPFTGEPLVITRKDGDWQVYSIGVDKIDNELDLKSDDRGTVRQIK